MEKDKDPLFATQLKMEFLHLQGVPPHPLARLSKKKIQNIWKPSFQKSIIIHSSFIVFCLLQGFVSNFFMSDSERQALLRAKQFKTAIRVDVVDLPRMKIEELNKVDLTKEVSENAKDIIDFTEPESEPEPVSKVDKKIDTKKISNTDMALNEKKKDSKSRLDELRKSMRAENKRKQVVEKLGGESATRQALAGNIVSEGYSTSGDIAKEIDAYTGSVYAHIKKHWTVAGWVKASKLNAQIRVQIAPDGRILSRTFVKKSGNSEYDAEVEKAILTADPLPPPPQALKNEVMEEGILCEF